MIYLVTSTLTKPNGRVCFNPVTDTEVFTSYISALRWLALERRNYVRLGWGVWTHMPPKRNDSGREAMILLCALNPSGGVYDIQISRINTNGFH